MPTQKNFDRTAWPPTCGGRWGVSFQSRATSECSSPFATPLLRVHARGARYAAVLPKVGSLFWRWYSRKYLPAILIQTATIMGTEATPSENSKQHGPAGCSCTSLTGFVEARRVRRGVGLPHEAPFLLHFRVKHRHELLHLPRVRPATKSAAFASRSSLETWALKN